MPDDLMRDLPLSWRERHDESAVSSDWRAELTRVLHAAADLIDQHSADTVSGAHDGVEAIRASERVLESGRRVPIKQLDRAVYAYLEVCEQLGAIPELDAKTSGAVALARATSAPTPIRAVIAGHSLRATDAGWSFGHGPELQATAVELLNFLGGRSLQAPTAGRNLPGL